MSLWEGYCEVGFIYLIFQRRSNCICILNKSRNNWVINKQEYISVWKL